MWGDHRAVTHCTCRQGHQGCLGLLASLLMMIMIPLGGGRPSLQLVSFLRKYEVTWWGGARQNSGGGEKGKKPSHLHSWWKNRSIYAMCLFIHSFVFKTREWKGMWMVRNCKMVTAQFFCKNCTTYQCIRIHSTKLMRCPGY